MTLPRSPQKFPKKARVRSKLDFTAIYERGLRISDSCMSLISLSNNDFQSRLGLAVSKRCGNSVQRNRLKRRLREAFRMSQAELPTGLDLVIQPRANTPIHLAVLRQSMISLAKRAAKKWASRTQTLAEDVSISDVPPGAT